MFYVSPGIVLSWNMLVSANSEEIATYQLYAYQETGSPPSSSLWKKVINTHTDNNPKYLSHPHL